MNTTVNVNNYMVRPRKGRYLQSELNLIEETLHEPGYRKDREKIAALCGKLGRSFDSVYTRFYQLKKADEEKRSRGPNFTQKEIDLIKRTIREPGKKQEKVVYLCKKLGRPFLSVYKKYGRLKSEINRERFQSCKKNEESQDIKTINHEIVSSEDLHGIIRLVCKLVKHFTKEQKIELISTIWKELKK